MKLPVPSVGGSTRMKLLPLVLSLIAGNVDAIGFLWHGVFIAHITGNLVLVAARLVAGTAVGMATILSVPVFVVALGLASMAATWLGLAGAQSLRPLLALQCLFLAAFLGLGVHAGTHGPGGAPAAVIALMLGVCGLAIQNTLVQASVRGAPSTAVMTTNLTRFMYDLSEMLLGKDKKSVDQARQRAARTWPAIIGFTTGGAAGAALYAGLGIKSLALPTGLALLALGLPGTPGPGAV